MDARFDFEIARQPDEESCGPTCLAAVYRHHGDPLPVERITAEVERLREGGTLAVLLGQHALRRGYRALLYSYNLAVLDPTWAGLPPTELRAKLAEQALLRPDAKRRRTISAYVEFLDLGGTIRFDELSGELLRRHLDRGQPLLTGLSATYLYQRPRERADGTDDDLRGEPAGHFVVLCGYDRASRKVLVADPLFPNELSHEGTYAVGIDRLIGAIFLGVLTYDGNLLVIEPAPGTAADRGAAERAGG